MPREDDREEKDYQEKNKPLEEEKVKIVSDSELINLKLNNVIENQAVLSNSLQNIIDLLSSEQPTQTDSDQKDSN